MATFFLVIIYMAFISLGLPDSLLGVAWPLMQPEYGVSFDKAGMLSILIAGGTITSSLVSGKILNRFGTGPVTFFSCLMTATSLLGFYFAPSFAWLILFTLPLGLGGGTVDAGLNHYVASHYKAHHMSWLHSFWGVGATAGPIVMAQFISGNNSWRDGYLAVAGLQFILVVILFITLPLWKKVASQTEANTNTVVVEDIQPNTQQNQKAIKPLRIRGVKFALLVFFFYCGVETTIGLWGSSFLVNMKDLSPDVAATWVSLYFAGITIGRFVTGFITFKVSNKVLIRSGQLITLIGTGLLLLPLPSVVSLIGFILIGLGLAPIFPCMIHETPTSFGKDNSQHIIGYQMALAYTGSTFLPPLVGFIATHTSIGIFPIFLTLFTVAMLFSSERLNGIINKKASLPRINENIV